MEKNKVKKINWFFVLYLVAIFIASVEFSYHLGKFDGLKESEEISIKS